MHAGCEGYYVPWNFKSRIKSPRFPNFFRWCPKRSGQFTCGCRVSAGRCAAMGASVACVSTYLPTSVAYMRIQTQAVLSVMEFVPYNKPRYPYALRPCSVRLATERRARSRKRGCKTARRGRGRSLMSPPLRGTDIIVAHIPADSASQPYSGPSSVLLQPSLWRPLPSSVSPSVRTRKNRGLWEPGSRRGLVTILSSRCPQWRTRSWLKLRICKRL